MAQIRIEGTGLDTIEFKSQPRHQAGKRNRNPDTRREREDGTKYSKRNRHEGQDDLLFPNKVAIQQASAKYMYKGNEYIRAAYIHENGAIFMA